VRKPDRRVVVSQTLSLLLVMAGVIVAVGFIQSRPAGGDDLDIQLSLLRSHAGDVALLTQQRAHVPAAFVRAQGKQLLQKIHTTQSDLEALQLRTPALQASRDAAVSRSRILADACAALAAGREQPTQ
jgi:hypothetical protein